MTLKEIVDSLTILCDKGHGDKQVLFHHHYGEESTDVVTLQIDDDAENLTLMGGVVNIILTEY